jgi:signal transduction histidine kinase
MLKHIFETNPLENISANLQMRSKMLNILLVGFAGMNVVVLLFLVIADKSGFMQTENIFYFACYSMFIATLLAFWANKKGWVYLGSSIFIFALILVVSVADTPEEVLGGRSLVFFIIPVMLSSFLLGSYTSFIVAVLVSIEHTIIWLVTDLGIMFNPFGIIAFFSFAYISWQAARVMEEALAQSYRVNAHLDELVSERTQKLVAANERLQELDVLKSKFVADVSHELRTPISNISIYLEMLEDTIGKLGNTLPQKVNQFIHVLRSETARLTNLINDVLNASNMEDRVDHMEFIPVDAQAILAGVVQTNLPRAKEKGLALTLSGSADETQILADEAQLKQIFTNLISNSINYTDEGTIHISTKVTENGLMLIRVQDTGMGIEREDIPHLFERFYRGKQAGRSAIPGTGLGLAITKEIVEAHEGHISVESELEHGTTFSVSFPLYEAGDRNE